MLTGEELGCGEEEEGLWPEEASNKLPGWHFPRTPCYPREA
jgi:hypothetical protein